MAKVTQLIQRPSLTEQARQRILTILSLAEKPVMPSEEYRNRLFVISMLAREVRDTIIDVESDKGSRNRACSDC
ncbi:hypothetical protein [Pantoea septica]|uniref:hypothetical protein n=1 Tax=Pantoea septica TaxID=472695 RepID=UPI00289924E6|nr:hypothetical protein [Pantoea septica]